MARHMDYEGAARRERLRLNGYVVAEPERQRSRRAARKARGENEASRERWRESDYAYCVVWVMKLHGIGFKKAKREFAATSEDVRRTMMEVARKRRLLGQAP
jgi:hypothetical protein